MRDHWRPGRLLGVLLFWTALTTVIFWLPLVRSVFDGSSYQWAFMGGLRGRGLEGALWFPIAGSAFALATLHLGWRGARFPFHPLLLIWHGFLGAGATYLGFARPEDFTFHGDTLGVQISLAYIGPLLFGGFALLAIYWVVRDLRSGVRREAPSWSRWNRVALTALAALLPLQFLMLRFGPPHGTTDQVGVILTIAQWLLVGVALRPRPGVPALTDSAGAPARSPG